MKPIDRTEAERLVQTYSDMILRLSYTYLKSTQDAEDICQTVFLKLLTGGMVFDSPEHEKAWIIRATANACKDALRASHRRCVGLEAVAETAAPEYGLPCDTRFGCNFQYHPLRRMTCSKRTLWCKTPILTQFYVSVGWSY